MDDNNLTMPGFVKAFEEADETELAGALSHAEALARCQEWCDVDVVVVDAADERAAGDQFPGVAVVGHIRACQAANRPIIIVVTGHYLHDGLRHRMAEVGADFFFFRRDLYTSERLVDVVVHPDRYRRGVPPALDAAAAEALGVGPATRIEPLVSYVEEHSLAAALDPVKPDREEPRSRKWKRHRKAISDASGLGPLNLTTGRPPNDSHWPSIRQLSRVWAWSARVREPYDPPRGEASDGKAQE